MTILCNGKVFFSDSKHPLPCGPHHKHWSDEEKVGWTEKCNLQTQWCLCRYLSVRWRQDYLWKTCKLRTSLHKINSCILVVLTCLNVHLHIFCSSVWQWERHRDTLMGVWRWWQGIRAWPSLGTLCSSEAVAGQTSSRVDKHFYFILR